MLSKERRSMGNEGSSYENSGNKISCRYLLVFRKIFTAASHTGKCSGYHMLTTFYFAPSSQLPNISHLLCLGQKSPLIIILLYYILVLPKSLSVCGCLKVLKGGCWNDTVWCQQGWYQRAWDGNKCRIKLGSKIQKQLQVRMNKC